MKVYRIDSDVNHYQYFLPEQESDAFKLFLDCESMAGSWIPHKVFIYKPKHKVGDLYNFSTGTLIFSPSATEKLQTFLEMAGELLPLPYKDKVYTVLNVTECINCLDTENSEWLVSQKTGEQFGTITKYIFHPNRFSESCIFKIPETSIVETLIVDWEDGEGFIDALKEHDIKGYLLTLLWSDS